MVHTLEFILACLLVVAGAGIGVRQLRLPNPLDQGIVFLTLAAAQIVVTLLLAGVVVRQLEPLTVIGLNALVVAGLVLVFGLPQRAQGERRRRPRARLEVLGLAALQNPWLIALLVLVVGEAAWRVFAAWVLPASGFDALWYHLTTVGWWLQKGTIGGNPLVLWSDDYPSDGELFAAWVALFLRSDTFVDIVQLPFAVLGGLAVAGIGRTVGLSARGAAAAGALFFLSPIVLVEASAAYVDLVFVAAFLVGLHFLLRFIDLGERRLLFLAGIGGGLALGSKYVGGLYFAVLLGAVLAALGVRRAELRAWPPALLIFAAPALVLGGFWYVRNWIQHGHPVYPYGQQSEAPFLSGPEGCRGLCLRETLRQWHQDHVPFVEFHRSNVELRVAADRADLELSGAPVALAYSLRLDESGRLVWSLDLRRRRPARVAALAVVVAVRRWSCSLSARSRSFLPSSGCRHASQGSRKSSRWGSLRPRPVVQALPSAPSSMRLQSPQRTTRRERVTALVLHWIDALLERKPHRTRDDHGGCPGRRCADLVLLSALRLPGSRNACSLFPLQRRSDRREVPHHERIGYVLVGAIGPYAGFARRAAKRGCLEPLYRDATALAYRIDQHCLHAL